MTKQVEIREGIMNLLGVKSHLEDWPSGRMRIADFTEEQIIEITTDLLSFLHSHGVVIKVERELPGKEGVIFSYGTGDDGIWDESQEAMINAGYVAVEPLI